tara:strand:+ start:1737 stop:1898 length:162 start_codon:yes stop_codon:yes gene_type:complete
MNKKAKLKLSISTIILTASISYLTLYWVKHSGLEDKILNSYDDIKNIFIKDKK